METSEILSRARELISTPERWTQGESARTTAGRHTNVENELAVCWCTLGAVCKVTKNDSVDYNRAAGVLAQVVRKQGLHANVIDYNDKAGRRHKEILELFDQAIAYAKNPT